jgi:hypothetical protein
MDILDIVDAPVKLQRLIRKLDFSEEDVEHAAMEQPTLAYEAARFRVQKMKERVQAEILFESKVSRYQARFREKKGDNGKRELTEGAVKDRVARLPVIRRLRRKYEMLMIAEEFAKSMTFLYNQRLNCIELIVSVRRHEGSADFRKVVEAQAKKKSHKLYKEARRRFSEVGEDDD